MFKKIIFFLFSLNLSLPVYSQLKIEGTVLNLSSKEPIAFVNIGIINTSLGTLSNEDGSFSIKIPQDYFKESIIFSVLGFEGLSILVSEFSKENYYTIYLKESPTRLNPVVITGESWKGKNYRLGNSRYEGSCIYADTITAGSAMALKINYDELVNRKQLEYPLFIKEAQVTIVNNTFGEFKIRTRLNEIDPSTGYPGKDILNTSIITRSSLKNGKLTVDLSKYNIEINQNFFLTFEWIFDKDDRNYLYQEYESYSKSHPDKVTTDYIYFGGEKIPFTNYGGNLYAGPSFGISLSKKSIESNTCFYRLNSLGKWKRSFLILAANIKLSDQPNGVKSDTIHNLVAYDDPSFGMMPYYKISHINPKNDIADISINFGKDTTCFSQRILEPISIQIRRINNHISFYAINQSFYPYQLELNFSKIRNLKPIITKKSFILKPDRTPRSLVTFDVVDSSIPEFHYNLEVSEDIGDTAVMTNNEFPYLLPVGNNREVGLFIDNRRINYQYRDDFKMFSSDTVFAMRKGMVVAIPVMENEADRISMNKTVEILHADGTVMVYYNISPANIFIQPDEYVFPGQPLGLVNDNNLGIELYQLIGNGKLKRLDIHYLTNKGICQYYEIRENDIATYPDTIIFKEMTRSEKNRYK